MKILILGASGPGGGGKRAVAFRDFLLSRNHEVNLIQFPGTSFGSKLWNYYESGYSILSGHEVRYMAKLADKLEKKIKKEAYNVVIGIETRWSYVVTRDIDCLKIFCCESLASEELRSLKNIDESRIEHLRETEIDMMKKSDYVVFPWGTTENYARKHVWNGNNFITLKYGCYPKSTLASYSYPPSIVSLGGLGGHANKDLLSQLTRITPYRLDVYSPDRPPKQYSLNYKGLAPTTDVLRNYQFGLNTLSKDPYRQCHFSSRVLGYLDYGLPVFSPEWMQLSHGIRGCIPYNEDNFINLIEKYSAKEAWEKLSEEAISQARELDWRNTLLPLEELISQA